MVSIYKSKTKLGNHWKNGFINRKENELIMERQSTYIDNKLNKTTLFNKYTAKLSGSNQDIVNTMNDSMRNIVQSFFKELFKVRKCEHCNTTNNSLQYERAHHKDSDRKKVALQCLQRIRKDESQEIMAKDFLKAFIEEHKKHIILYLCKPCHREYDKK